MYHVVNVFFVVVVVGFVYCFFLVLILTGQLMSVGMCLVQDQQSKKHMFHFYCRFSDMAMTLLGSNPS